MKARVSQGFMGARVCRKGGPPMTRNTTGHRLTRITHRLIYAVGACVLASAGVLPSIPVANAQAPAPSPPTFTKDVLPILQKSCQRCHRAGTPAPMSLMTYAEV